MQLLNGNSIDIRDIIKKQSIMIHFQPIVSIKKKSIIGMEALCRGVDPETGVLISPARLFSLAREENQIIELDRLCRRTALTNYKAVFSKRRDLILFLNLDTSIMDMGVVGSGHLLRLVNELNINPGNVVIEVVESAVSDLAALKRFIKTHKDYGFLIALDDTGSGYSNLDRIPLVKPDILKIDRSLISGINKKYYKQEVFKSLVNLSKRIGALVVAEGVENEDEAILVLELGADLLQGYHISRPKEYVNNGIDSLGGNIDRIASKYRGYMVDKIRSLQARYREYDRILGEISGRLSKLTMDDFNNSLREYIDLYPLLDCVYVISHRGIQITETFCNGLPGNHLIYKPADIGTDHALKDYYYLIMNTGLDKFTTEPYISLASGNLCITISSPVRDADNNSYVLCLDINPDQQ